MAAPLPYPALVASHAGNWIAFPGGETRAVGRGEGIARAADTPVILLNAPLTAARLGYPELSGLTRRLWSASSKPRASPFRRPRAWSAGLGLVPRETTPLPPHFCIGPPTPRPPGRGEKCIGKGHGRTPIT